MLPFSYQFLWVLSLQGCFLSLNPHNSPSLSRPDNSFIIKDAILPSSIQLHYAPFSLISPSVASLSHFTLASIINPSTRVCYPTHQPSPFPRSSFSPLLPLFISSFSQISQLYCQHSTLSSSSCLSYGVRSWADMLVKKDPELCSRSCNDSSNCNAFLSPNKMLLLKLLKNPSVCCSSNGTHILFPGRSSGPLKVPLQWSWMGDLWLPAVKKNLNE